MNDKHDIPSASGDLNAPSNDASDEASKASNKHDASMKSDTAKKPVGAFEGPGCTVGGITLIVFILMFYGMLSFCSEQSKENARIAAQEAADNAKEEDARYQERVRNGSVCADGPDDLNTSLEWNVKRSLKEPSSFEHMGTVITPAKNGKGYDALMRFRSKNSFGGYAVGTAVAKLYLAEKGLCQVSKFEIIG
ncbi:hypothetical protein [Sphingomonas parapaucimobilis]|uniref:hypothetical protein n=1 Tax=Sphingomonas parapaucimobilis TaxID=28213 RepID=UPI00391DDC36